MKQSSRQWLCRQLNDGFVKQASTAGYRSRAIFKLMEIDDKFALIKNATSIIDLGAAPGSWSQLLAARAAENAKIVALDLLPFAPLDRVHQYVGNFEDMALQSAVAEYLEQKADLILSDMSPSTTGHRQIDHLKIMALVENVLIFACKILQMDGALVIKIFQGGEEKRFASHLKTIFRRVVFFKPQASRNESREIYLVASGFVLGRP
ncbi:MAG: RlmE family RNA methyltransferase [Holosporaceae bacterium]|nr:RlmE family RNA methyltransferase [Holosporaceae bacterium]